MDIWVVSNYEDSGNIMKATNWIISQLVDQKEPGKEATKESSPGARTKTVPKTTPCKGAWI